MQKFQQPHKVARASTTVYTSDTLLSIRAACRAKQSLVAATNSLTRLIIKHAPVPSSATVGAEQ